MKNNISLQIGTAIILIVLFLLLWNPFSFWMPSMAHMIILALVFAGVSFFAAFVLLEGASDEREELHRYKSGRNAFLLGALVITLGIIYEGVTDKIDPWLIAALLAMIISKIVSRIASEKNG